MSFFSGHGDADEVRPGGGELVDLGDAGVDVVGVAGGHRLDGDRRIAADADEAVCGVAERQPVASCGVESCQVKAIVAV